MIITVVDVFIIIYQMFLMIYCLLTEFCIKGKNKACCIVICYCELNTEKNIKDLLKN